jgi:hypothetical protein
MPFDINEFRSVVYAFEGFQKINKFLVRFPVPPCIGNVVLPVVRSLEFFCQSIDLPGVQAAQRPVVRYGYGVAEKKPMFVGFSDVMLSFLADGNHYNLMFFQWWMNSIFNFNFSRTINDVVETSGYDTHLYELAYAPEYKVEVEILLWDEHGKETLRMVLRDCYPSAIIDQKMDMETGQFMKMVVMFCFTDWYLRAPVEEPPAALMPSIREPIRPPQPPEPPVKALG